MIRKVFFLACFIIFTSAGIQAQVTAQFRGLNRDGVYPEKNLLASWPEGGPAQLWINNEIGNGFGPPAVTSERVYVTGEIDTVGYLFAFDLKGKLLWKSDYGKEWVKTFPGSRSTPTIVGNLIYVCSGLGNLSCFNAANGSKKWMVDMKKDLHGQFTLHGHAESPLVDGDQVFLTPGGSDTNVVALNRFTGKLNWTCKGFGEIPGYNSPIMINLPSLKILVTFSAYHLMGIDAETGKLLWAHEQINVPLAERKPGMGDTHSNSAYYENGYIYYVAGDNNCGTKLKLSEDGKQITQVWNNKALDNFMGGFIKIDNHIYTGSESKRSLICADANTGQVVDSLKIGSGSLALADNMLYYYNQRGEMNLVKPALSKMEFISKFKITSGTKEHFSHPVIKDGILYIRRGKALMAYDIRKN
ncbi:MAG: PQQ-binding-like beta-propeller repeat protein [Lentimicrobiaceae bacterium]|jgi:outer membrane protein assembly factor BamB